MTAPFFIFPIRISREKVFFLFWRTLNRKRFGESVIVMNAENNEAILAALARIETRLAALEDSDRQETRRERPAPLARGQAPGVINVPISGNEEEQWMELPEDRVAAIMAPFANEQRIKLLKALYMGTTESGRLKDLTGLTGGQLYHHLKELALGKFLSRPVRGEYRLSAFGYYTFSALMILISDLIAEQMNEEIITPEEIDQLD